MISNNYIYRSIIIYIYTDVRCHYKNESVKQLPRVGNTQTRTYYVKYLNIKFFRAINKRRYNNMYFSEIEAITV